MYNIYKDSKDCAPKTRHKAQSSARVLKFNKIVEDSKYPPSFYKYSQGPTTYKL